MNIASESLGRLIVAGAARLIQENISDGNAQVTCYLLHSTQRHVLLCLLKPLERRRGNAELLGETSEGFHASRFTQVIRKLPFVGDRFNHARIFIENLTHVWDKQVCWESLCPSQN